MGGVQVVVEQAPPARPSARPSLGAGQFRGVRAQQVVERVAAGGVFAEQAGPGELGQQRGRPGAGGRPARLAAAAAAGCRGPGAATAAGTAAPRRGQRRYDQEKTARTSVAGSPPANAASRPWFSRSSAAMSASGKCGWPAARAATMASASGSRAHTATISSAARRSASTRRAAEPPGEQLAGPRRRSSRSEGERVRAVAGDQAGQPVRGWSPRPGSPASRAAAAAPARSSRALSSTTSIRRPASRLR